MVKFRSFLLSSFIAAFTDVATPDFIPSTIVTGDVPIITTAQPSFDGPMVGAVNSTSLDWWYFDAVSEDGSTGASIVFLRTVIFDVSVSADFVQVTLKSNGISLDEIFEVNSSSVSTAGFGASGSWPGVGSFEVSPDLSQYTVKLNTGSIQGTLTVRSIAPAHYPDGSCPGTTNASVLVAPALYWTNAVPGGVATANFEVNGETLQFQNGIGYHDQNWGGLSIANTIILWYWGHATVGPYTFVYFNTISAITNMEFSSVYLVNGDQIQIARQFSSSNLTNVLPFGNGTQFPPSNTTNLPSGFQINFVGSNYEEWSFLLESVHIVSNREGIYTRWIGTATGGKDGGLQYSGSGVWEWMRFI